MIRVAFLEHERETKEISFILANILKEVDWTFRCFFKASELARRMKEEQFQIFIFDEMFKSPRLESVFVHDNPSAIFIYVCDNPKLTGSPDERRRIFYINKSSLKENLTSITEDIIRQAKQQEVYKLVYNGVSIDLPIEDIYYMEKLEKNVFFHTKKGEFHRRLNLSDLDREFEPYGFVRVHVSYLVNSKYITAVFKDEIEVNHKERIPMSRAQKKKLGLKVRKSSKAEK